MAINIGDALSAYRATLKNLDGADKTSGASGAGESFGDMLGGMLGNSVDKLKEAEKVSFAAVQGKAGVNEVVAAVSAAEVALQTVVTIRDRLVSAYQELMRSGV